MTSAATEPARFTLRCTRCGAEAAPRATACAGCGAALTVVHALAPGAPVVDPARAGLWRYAPFLPIIDADAAISLGEGATPLVPSRSLGPALGLRRLFFKMESANPTGSYKDRIASVGLSRMRELGVRGWAATSSGNAGAALAAYGARAGMRGTLFTLETAPRAKLTQILAYGPRVLAIRGLGYDPEVERRTFQTVRGLCEANDWAMQITAHVFNPVGMEGARTIAFEVVEALGRFPDQVYVPTGGGGLLSAIHKGLREWRAAGPAAGPGASRVVCVQAAGCDPINQAWREDRALRSIPTCTSRISGIQLTAPPDGDLALAALRDSGGWATSVPDEAVWAAQRQLAQREGIFCEPASAAGVAGVLADAAAGRLGADDVIVCVITGVGFKDAAAATALSEGVEIPVLGLDALAGHLAAEKA
ncbi:MAG: pyridoxal-phosphate dependent enzyme [Thermoflexales bacterium]|nr:pyridoxal-phosphate dependent enzyme [Thermoflexales bacterium]